jgi:hypothetical protein
MMDFLSVSERSGLSQPLEVAASQRHPTALQELQALLPRDRSPGQRDSS